jgi:uncharacterized iron-regulated membrane protein
MTFIFNYQGGTVELAYFAGSLTLAFAVALAVALGAAACIPPGPGGVDHLVLPAVAFPLLWVALGLVPITARQRRAPRKALFRVHQAAGLLLATVGLLVWFSGSLAVFAPELDAWTHRGTALPPFELDRSEPGALDLAFARASEGVPETLPSVHIRPLEGGPLAFFFHGDAPTGLRVRVHPATGEVLDRAWGTRAELFAPSPREALAAFLVELHLQLLLPRTWGLLATGAVGFGLLLLAISGLWTWRPTLRKLSRLPSSPSPRRGWGQLHGWLGAWSFPFAATISTTGAFFSFSGAVLLPLLAMVVFDGDREAMSAALVGTPAVQPSPERAPLRPLLADASARVPGAHLLSIDLESWGRDDAHAVVRLIGSPGWDLSRRQLVYDGHTGERLADHPSLGSAPSAGSALFASMAVLHFGTLAGPLTRPLWSALGLLTCAVAGAGLLGYAAGRPSHLAGRVFVGLAVAGAAGLPLASAAVLLAWELCMAAAIAPRLPMTAALAVSLLASAAVGTAAPVRRAVGLLLAPTGLLFACATALAGPGTGLTAWQALADPVARGSVAVDACLAAAALLSLGGSAALLRAPLPLSPAPSPTRG